MFYRVTARTHQVHISPPKHSPCFPGKQPALLHCNQGFAWRCRGNWVPWTEKNIRTIKARMRLARVLISHPSCYLGFFQGFSQVEEMKEPVSRFLSPLFGGFLVAIKWKCSRKKKKNHFKSLTLSLFRKTSSSCGFPVLFGICHKVELLKKTEESHRWIQGDFGVPISLYPINCTLEGWQLDYTHKLPLSHLQITQHGDLLALCGSVYLVVRGNLKKQNTDFRLCHANPVSWSP